MTIEDFRYTSQSYDTIANELDQARHWYETILKKPLDGTRLPAIQRIVTRVLEILSGPERESFFEHIDQTTAYYALVDAQGFSKIAKRFGSLSPQIMPRKLLWRSLQGPVSPKDESIDETDARNIFTQLEFAANAIEKGLDPVGFEDLEFLHGGCRFTAECKRLGSISDIAIQRNIATAEGQLMKSLDDVSDRMRRGLLVLELDRLTGLGTALPTSNPVVDITQVQEVSRTITSRFITNFGATIRDLDSRIIGVAIVIRMLIHEVQDGTWASVYNPVIVPLATKGSDDYARLQAIAEQLH